MDKNNLHTTSHIANSGAIPIINMIVTIVHPYQLIQIRFAIATGHMPNVVGNAIGAKLQYENKVEI